MTHSAASTKISSISAWEALDSRGTPTVACAVQLADGSTGSATVPSGASTGTFEALELRDGGDRYAGKGVKKAVSNVTGPLADAVRGLDALDQEEVDTALREADATPGLSRYGANAVLAISVANALAASAATGLPLYRLVGEDAEPLLPMPMVNIISGGAHAGGAVDIQDVLVVPIGATSFAQAIEWAALTRRGTASVMRERGLGGSLIADEGGLAASLPTNRAALDLIVDGMQRAGLRPGEDVAIAIDIAASQFFDASVPSR